MGLTTDGLISIEIPALPVQNMGNTECFSAFQRRIFGSFVYNVDMMGDDTSCFLSSRLFLWTNN